MKPKIIHKSRLFTGQVVRIDQVDIDFQKSDTSHFELISFNVETGVSALPVIDGDVLLIYHYQAGLDADGWSLPTGGLHPGEDPSTRMQLELQEEIGYKANQLTLMTRITTIASYVASKPGYVFLAQDLVPSKLPGDEPFPITTKRLSLNKAIKMIQSGAIQDSRVILALLYFQQFFT
jgi:ADP-ribose diphosphatase